MYPTTNDLLHQRLHSCVVREIRHASLAFRAPPSIGQMAADAATQATSALRSAR